MTIQARTSTDFSDLPPVDGSLFRRTARLSETLLLSMLWSMADADDIGSLCTFVDDVQKNGSPGTMYDTNTNLASRSGDRSYPAVFAHALRSQSRSFAEPMPWTPAQTGLFDQMMAMVENHPERTSFLKSLSTSGIAAVQEKRFFEDLGNAIGPLQHEIASASSGGWMVNMLEQALLKQNAQAAVSLIGQVAPNQVVDVLQHMCHIEEKKNSQLTNAILEMPGQCIADVLEAFEGHAPMALVGKARFALIDTYLYNCLHSETAWKRSELEQLCGKNGFDPSLSPLLPAITAQAEALKPPIAGMATRPHFSKSTVVAAMGCVLSTHCVPLLEIMGPVVVEWRKPENRQPKVYGLETLLQQSNEPGSDPLWKLSDFTACFHLMQKFGHDPNEANAKWDSLFHVLAAGPLQPKHGQKFVALLDLGLNPFVKNGDDKTAMEVVDPEIGKQWESIAASHKARNTAHGILNEIEDSPKSKMTP